MKIDKWGTVTFTESNVLVEGWLITREPEVDPADATNEQLILGFAIVWAKSKFEEALKDAKMDVFRKMIQKQIDAKLPKPD